MSILSVYHKLTTNQLSKTAARVDFSHLELKSHSANHHEYNPFLYLKVFSMRRSFVANLQSVCIRNFDIKDHNIRKVCSILIYLPFIKEFEFFRTLYAETLDPLLLPNLLQIFRRPSNTIEVFAISKNSASPKNIFSERDLYMLGKISEHLRYMFSFYGGFDVGVIFHALAHFLFSGVEQSSRRSALTVNFNGIQRNIRSHSEESLSHFQKLLGEEDPFMHSSKYFDMLTRRYRTNKSSA